MKKIALLNMFLVFLCGQLMAMQKTMISPTQMCVTKGPFERTYEYDPSYKRWKIKKEVHNLWRSSGQEKITRVFFERGDMVDVDVSIMVNGPNGYQPAPGRKETITSADYEAHDYRERY